MYLDMSTLAVPEVYALMTQTIIPRPVAWVLSDNGNDTYNLAPFSYFNALCSDPPMVMLSIGLRPDGSAKDTRVNIEERRDFVLHIAHREMASNLTASSATMAPGVSEIDALGLATVPMQGSRLPRLADCRIAYACELVNITFIKKQAIVMAELKHLYVADEVVGEDAKGRLKVLGDKVDPLGRLGGGEYVTAGELIDIARPA